MSTCGEGEEGGWERGERDGEEGGWDGRRERWGERETELDG